MQIKQFPFNKKMLSQKSCTKMFRRRKQKMSKWKDKLINNREKVTQRLWLAFSEGEIEQKFPLDSSD